MERPIVEACPFDLVFRRKTFDITTNLNLVLDDREALREFCLMLVLYSERTIRFTPAAMAASIQILSAARTGYGAADTTTSWSLKADVRSEERVQVDFDVFSCAMGDVLGILTLNGGDSETGGVKGSEDSGT
jgi:hypothetical protein